MKKNYPIGSLKYLVRLVLLGIKKMQIAITKMSSKGQIVIPQEMRKDLKAGEKIVIIKNGESLLLKKEKYFSKKLEEDLEFARRTEEAYKRYEKGEFISMEYDEFLEEVKKW